MILINPIPSFPLLQHKLLNDLSPLSRLEHLTISVELAPGLEGLMSDDYYDTRAELDMILTDRVEAFNGYNPPHAGGRYPPLVSAGPRLHRLRIAGSNLGGNVYTYERVADSDREEVELRLSRMRDNFGVHDGPV